VSSKRELKLILDLEKSDAWQYLTKIMQDEIVQAAMQMGEDASMTFDEVNFRRGAIWAANRMLEMPNRIKAKLEAEIALSSGDDKKTPKD
tara:strand:- start:303 stop:572 length:270 start_codon:yes stop_codon:yes gene_type:complete